MFINGELPKDEKYPLSCVYWIYHEDKHTDPRNSGYVGISSKGLPTRLKQHERDTAQGSNLRVHNAMRKYGDKVKAKILLEASPEICQLVEEMYRPVAQMGGMIWNIGSGGNATTLGYKHTEETKNAIREAVLGRKHSEASIEKMSETQKTRPRSQEEIAKVVARNRAGLSPESALKRNISISLTRKMQPWRNSSVKDKSVWENAVEIEKYLTQNPSSTITQTAKVFGTTRDKMESIQNRIENKWSPVGDELFLAWISEQKENNVT